MTKEEIKANELIESFIAHVNEDWFSIEQNAIICAIICVDEILKSRPTAPIVKNSEDYYLTYFELVTKNKDFWQSVKQILESK